MKKRVWVLQLIAAYVRITRGTAAQSQGLACEDRMEDTRSDAESAQEEHAKAFAAQKQKADSGVGWGQSDGSRSP